MMRLLPSAFGQIGSTVLEGQRLLMRAPVMADWQEWARLRSASREFLEPWEPVWPADALSRAAFARRVRRYGADWQTDVGYGFLIYLRGVNQGYGALVGGLNLSNVRRGVAQMGTIGYWTGASFAGRGYMTEAVGMVCRFAFAELRLHRIEAACIPDNMASRRVLAKAGFRQEGFAERYLRINGQWRDHLLFGMDVERFQTLPPAAAGKTD
jgi:[ribosomal protein S5]-alanine N-acetyltransferase